MRALETHVKDAHDFISALDSYAAFFHGGVIPKCGCGCGEDVKWSWSAGFAKFRRGHNGNLVACYGEERARQISEIRAASLRGQVGWARGLTKESSEIIKNRSEISSIAIKKSFEEGRTAWNLGLSSLSDPRIAAGAVVAHENFKSGKRVAWHKGKTKETSAGLHKMSESIKKRFKDSELKERLTSLKRLSEDEVLLRLKHHAPSLELVSNIQQYTRDRHDNLVFRCKNCGDTRQRSLISALTDRCHTCNPNASKDQLEISKFLRSSGIAHVISNRTEISPFELDIWSSQACIAIEYNGLYFHSERFKDKDYHAKKSQLADTRGIRLIHVFEDEWRDRRTIVESMLLHKFGMTTRRIAARKCEIRSVSTLERQKFFNDSHLDGDAPAKVAWGLYFNDELVSCISLRRPINKKYDGAMEICRFSCSTMTHVSGALGKLMKVASSWCREMGYSTLMTYVDTRHGNGKGYINCGFKVIGKTANRFWWTNDVDRYDRFVFRANSKMGLSEQKVAEQAGVKKIWCCPNLVLTRPV